MLHIKQNPPKWRADVEKPYLDKRLGLFSQIALFSRHPSNEQKIGITKFKSFMRNDYLSKGFSRPRQTIIYPTDILTESCLKVKDFYNGK